MKSNVQLLCLVLAFLCLVPLAACSQKDEGGIEPPSGFVLAENENTDYYFFYPSTWTLDRNDAGMTSAFVSEVDYSNVSVTAFTASAEYPSLADYAEHYYFKQFEDNFQSLEIERNQDKSLKKSVLKIDSADAIAVNYKANFAGEEYSFRAWMISYNGYIYTVLYTAKTAQFEAHLDEATVIAENLKFR